MDIELIMEILIIGESAVGKSNLLLRYIEDRFDEGILPTIGCDYLKTQRIIRDKKFLVKFWDTAGQEKFRSLSRSYYEKAHAVILVYDVTNKNTLTKLSFWLSEIKNNCKRDVMILLIGNKNDLLEDRQVNEKEGLNWARENGMLFMETSAKTNDNNRVNIAFNDLLDEIARVIIQKEKENFNRETLLIRSQIQQLNKPLSLPEKTNSKKCC